MPDASFESFLSELRENAPILPKPEGEEAWDDHVARVSQEGVIAEIDEEQFDYWLDVLPPHYQRGYLFAFAEGAEPFRLFWKEKGGRFFARQLTWDETRKFCRLSGASVPPRD